MINPTQLKLYEDLMILCDTTEVFYYQDVNLDDSIYRIFNYRLASYTDFLRPNALECRGHMFEIGSNFRLASWCQHKFFNYLENPMTMNIDLSQIDKIEHKLDGSLISTYLHNNELRLKSKGALFSDQAIAATQWLDLPENLEFKTDLYNNVISEQTVNIEWTSPYNRIVVGYIDPRLFVLNIRNNIDGSYIEITPNHPLFKYTKPPVDLNGLDKTNFVNNIPNIVDDIEGYVIKLTNGLWMKIKTNKYKQLHTIKSNINSPRVLLEAIIDENIDDMRVAFKDDIVAMKIIDEMQIRVNHIYNSMVKEVEDFYNINKHLERKEFAIKGQAELDKRYFGLVMSKYQDKDPQYKQYLKSKWKSFGFKDEQIDE